MIQNELLRRREMMVQASTPPVTGGWIRNETEGAYINTGIIPDQDTRVVMKARGITPGLAFLFGARVGYATKTFTLLAVDAQNTMKYRLDYGTTQNLSSVVPGSFFFEHEYDFNGNVLYIDGVQVASASSATFTPNLQLYIFGINNNGTFAGGYHPFDISTVKIYQNGVLVRDFEAISNPIGFYDKVSGTTFTNAGTGNLAYIADHPNDALCTQLEYIESTASPTGFDSGVYATRDLFVTSTFYLTAGVKKWQSYLGTRPSSGNDFELSFGTTSYANARAYHKINGGSSTASPNTSTNNYMSSVMLIWQKNTSGNSRIWKSGTSSTIGNVTQTASASYQSQNTLGVGALNYAGGKVADLADGTALGFFGRIYSCSLGYERCYVPVLYGGVAGLYDLLTDTFHSSQTMHAFVAGPTI